jgi:hypothetical protein
MTLQEPQGTRSFSLRPAAERETPVCSARWPAATTMRDATLIFWWTWSTDLSSADQRPVVVVRRDAIDTSSPR